MQLQLKISTWFVLTEKQNIVEMLNSVISFGNIPEFFVFPDCLWLYEQSQDLSLKYFNHH